MTEALGRIQSTLLWLFAINNSNSNISNNNSSNINNTILDNNTIASNTSTSPLGCPAQGMAEFALEQGEWLTLLQHRNNATNADLCTLSMIVTTQDGQSDIPMARTYNGHGWERAGSGVAAQFPEWQCNDNYNSCTSWLPAGQYKLQTRRPSSTRSNDAQVARFLESASFGVTPSDLASWRESLTDGASNNASSSEMPLSTLFAKHVSHQMEQITATNHREYFRRNANPSWRFHKPEFAAALDPCAPGSTWRRNALAVKDQYQEIQVAEWRSDDNDGDSEVRWQVSIGGHVRTIVKQLRLQVDNSQLVGKAKVCGSTAGMRNGIYKVATRGRCQELITDDVVIDFPAGYEPPAVLSSETQLPELNDVSGWKNTSDVLPTYLLLSAVSPDSCASLPEASAWGPPVFAKTLNGEWVMHDPRVVLEENTVESPLIDGGAASWSLGETAECSNVRRSFHNEASCRLSDTVTCLPGAADPSEFTSQKSIVCGSIGEVGNDPSLGDSWLDIPSIDGRRSKALGVPKDTSGPDTLERQRVYIWNTIALTAQDQLRQRTAWALLQIFALPRFAIGSQKFNTEVFLIYYDIFVRHAFGNYRDILREVTYNPLTAESLSFRESKSRGYVHVTSKGQVAYPDENYARELMQLFTIGLIELNMDGTPVLDAQNKTIRTYDSEAIQSFARVWTGFKYQPARANVEGYDYVNRFDPLAIVPEWRDLFPKHDLHGGYIGDGYPLCTDLPARAFLRVGAKYRLLGSSPNSDVHRDHKSWSSDPAAKRLKVDENGTGLYDKLCEPSEDGSCGFPVLVVLDMNLDCMLSNSEAPECGVDTVRVVQVGDLFYEYVPMPCVELSFYTGGQKAMGANKWSFCVNPDLARATEACCLPDLVELWKAQAEPACIYAGERMKVETAAARCESQGKELCTNYGRFNPTVECPHFGYHWTSVSCRVQAKVAANGEAAIVHDTGKPAGQVTLDTPNFFRVYWVDGEYPKAADNCGDGACLLVDGNCLCDVEVSESTIFDAPPAGPNEILEHSQLGMGHAGPDIYDTSDYVMVDVNGYRHHSPDGSCCNLDTVFEVTEPNGRVRFWRNAVSVVSIEETDYKFRNPPQFNSVVETESVVTDAEHENEALLDHLFYDSNTPPFVAYRMIQRFGFSNPSPRYVKAVATAFHDGTYTADGEQFGAGVYGDMAATVAAVLLDREARSHLLEEDPSHGSLREPILKVLSFMRAMEFDSSVPLVDLDLMSAKIGQMVYDQPTVFSFFRPEYSAPGTATAARLTSPEAEVMSAGRIVGLMNGLFALVDNGLQERDNGFGHYSLDGASTGALKYQPLDAANRTETVADLSTLLTGGRLGAAKRNVIMQAITSEPDDNSAFRKAMKLITTTPEFHTTNKVDAVKRNETAAPPPQAAASDGGDNKRYKAVIHLTLQGGCDSYNMLVPHPTECSKLYQEYKNIRDGIAMTSENLLRLDGNTTGQPCDVFGLHKALPLLKELYDAEDLLFLANTGVLTELVNKSNFAVKTETQLFAHNSMQEEVDSLDPRNLERGTGALGRMADALLSAGYRAGRTAVEVPPRNLAGRLEAVSPVFALDQGEVTPLDVDLSSPILRDVMSALNGESNGEKSGVYGEVWSSVLDRSLNITEKVFYLLQSNTPTQTNFTDSDLARRFKLISQLISTREKREVDRDFFTVRYEGFDMHGSVADPLYDRFTAMNAALTDLVTELKLLGVWDDVVIVQTSDFGRTLTPNSGGGSDHGWGGNYWMMGGDVKGKQIVGKYPSSFAPDGELVLGGRGRVIPTTPWESAFNAIGQWMDAGAEDLDTVLPNRASFDSLYQSSDLFE